MLEEAKAIEELNELGYEEAVCPACKGKGYTVVEVPILGPLTPKCGPCRGDGKVWIKTRKPQ
jgi:hypothetical protein